jgi:hypothetical protein
MLEVIDENLSLISKERTLNLIRDSFKYLIHTAETVHEMPQNSVVREAFLMGVNSVYQLNKKTLIEELKDFYVEDSRFDDYEKCLRTLFDRIENDSVDFVYIDELKKVLSPKFH